MTSESDTMVQAPAISPFSLAARAAFDSFVVAHGLQRRARPTDTKHAMIREYLSETRAVITQEDRKLKHTALTQYLIVDGRLHSVARPGVGNEARLVPRDEEVFDIITTVHLGLVHAGRDKTFQEVERTTAGIRKKEVVEILQHCSTCATKASQKSKTPLQAIFENVLWGRVQIDLIDMRGDADADQKCICHLRDHLSKYSVTSPMANKTCAEVVKVVLSWILHFGPPRILQSDNGTEFKGTLLVLLRDHGIKMINGRPRHPQSQGMVEQANGVLKEKIAAWRSDHQSSSWVSSLPEVIAAMNSQRSSVTGKSAYEIVFGQPPHGHPVSYLTRDRVSVSEEDEALPGTASDRPSNPIEQIEGAESHLLADEILQESMTTSHTVCILSCNSFNSLTTLAFC